MHVFLSGNCRGKDRRTRGADEEFRRAGRDAQIGRLRARALLERLEDLFRLFILAVGKSGGVRKFFQDGEHLYPARLRAPGGMRFRARGNRCGHARRGDGIYRTTEEDTPPTLLKNRGPAKSAEFVTNMYSAPRLPRIRPQRRRVLVLYDFFRADHGGYRLRYFTLCGRVIAVCEAENRQRF